MEVYVDKHFKVAGNIGDSDIKRTDVFITVSLLLRSYDCKKLILRPNCRNITTSLEKYGYSVIISSD